MAAFTSKEYLGILGGHYVMAVCKQTLTTDGHIASLDTGFGNILAAFVQVISDNPATATEAAYCTVDHGADGLLDIYAWQDDIATEAATETSVYVLVFGY